jgi:hypothetical protein
MHGRISRKQDREVVGEGLGGGVAPQFFVLPLPPCET